MSLTLTNRIKMNTKLVTMRIEVGVAIFAGYQQNVICVPNVSYGYFHSHEADLIAMRCKTGYMTEYEIKRSWQDFLHDFKKHTTHFEGKVSQLFYVVPECLAERCWEYISNYEWPEPYNITKVGERIPPVGLISYNEYASFKIVHQAPMLYRFVGKMRDYKLTDAEMFKIARLGCFRIWEREKAAIRNERSKVRELPLEFSTRKPLYDPIG